MFGRHSRPIREKTSPSHTLAQQSSRIGASRLLVADDAEMSALIRPCDPGGVWLAPWLFELRLPAAGSVEMICGLYMFIVSDKMQFCGHS